MRWFEVCDNPFAITAYYNGTPSLDDVVLRELQLMNGSPSVHFWLELARPPDLRWVNWDNSNEVPTIVLALAPVTGFRLQGWGHESRGSFRLERVQSKVLAFGFESSWFSCEGFCEHVMIDTFRPSRRG